MKLDAHMPFYGNDFFAAMEGYSDAIQNGYLRALWHYWSHTHCSGLPDDDDYLRRICRCDLGQWPRTKGIIFGLFFVLNGDKWHQSRSKTEYTRASVAYKSKVAAVATARNKSVNRGVNKAVNKPSNSPKSEPEPEPESDQEPQSESKQFSVAHTHNGEPEKRNCASPKRLMEKELREKLRGLLGEDEMDRGGGYWMVHWIKPRPDLVRSAIEDLESKLKDGFEPDNRGAWLTDLLKRWIEEKR